MDQKYLLKIKACVDEGRTIRSIDVKALLAEVERLNDENHRQFKMINQQGRELNRRDEIIKQQDQQISTLKKALNEKLEQALPTICEGCSYGCNSIQRKKALPHCLKAQAQEQGGKGEKPC